MRLQISEPDGQPGTVVAKVEGVVDSATLEDFFRAISGIFTGGTKNVVLDVSHMSFISSGGLSVLQDAHKKAESRGGKVLIAGVNEQIRELFEVVGFHKIFPLYRDLDAALEDLR